MNAKRSMILAMVIYGTLAPFVRRIGISSAEVALSRALIALVVVQAARRLAGRRLGAGRLAPGRDAGLLFLSGALMGLNWVFLFQAYRYTTVSVATLSYYFAPAIVMAVSALVYREPMTRRQVLCFAGATLGLVLVVNPGGFEAGSGHLAGVAFGLAAAVLYASVILLNRRIRSTSGIDRTLLQFMAAAAVLLPYVCLTGGFHLAEMDGAGWLSLAAVGLIHTGAAYVLYFSALKSLPGREVAILSYIDPLVAVVVSLVILAEPVTPLQLVGGALILALTLLSELRK